jgi:hypothetical protein
MNFIPRFRLAILISLCAIGAASAAAPHDDPVKMAPFVVQSSYSEASFRARFRYNIPGKPLKYLVITKAPKLWIEGGAREGDRLVAIDDDQIDGKSIVHVVRLIDSRVDQPMKFTLADPKTHAQREIMILFKKGSGDLTIHFP